MSSVRTWLGGASVWVSNRLHRARGECSNSGDVAGLRSAGYVLDVVPEDECGGASRAAVKPALPVKPMS